MSNRPENTNPHDDAPGFARVVIIEAPEQAPAPMPFDGMGTVSVMRAQAAWLKAMGKGWPW